jgi:hypothetical protein
MTGQFDHPALQETASDEEAVSRRAERPEKPPTKEGFFVSGGNGSDPPATEACFGFEMLRMRRI